MSYNTKHQPQVHDRSKHSKGNGSGIGRSSGHNVKRNDKGIFYPGGLGCSLSNNCFECPRALQGLDCNWGNAGNPEEFAYIANRGHGIKVW